MYLTRFTINTARRGARRLLSSPQTMHAAVLASFPDEQPADGTRPRPLWRIDHGEHSRAVLYVASPEKPDLTHLVEQAGWPASDHTWETKPYLHLLQRLTVGQRWAFRLTANPAHNGRPRRADSGGDEAAQQKGPAATRRYGHVTVAQQRRWLLERAAAAGFGIPTTEAGEPDLVIHGRTTRSFNRDGQTVTLRFATYDGHLEVVDVDRLRAALVRGIGHGKAYGCGLLTLAEPKDVR